MPPSEREPHHLTTASDILFALFPVAFICLSGCGESAIRWTVVGGALRACHRIVDEWWFRGRHQWMDGTLGEGERRHERARGRGL